MEEIDVMRIYDSYSKIEEINEIVGIYEIHIDGCPVKLKIKIVKLYHQDVPDNASFMGIANYGIKNPHQADPYWSIHEFSTPQEALENAISGFLMFWNFNEAKETSFKLMEDW